MRHQLLKLPALVTGPSSVSSSPSPTMGPGKAAAIFLVLIFCFAECAAGSCLSYGHSCWGAHGKRSGQLNDEQPIRNMGDTNWLLSKLIRAPLDIKEWNNNNVDGNKEDRNNVEHQFYNSKDRSQDERDPSDFQDILPAGDDLIMYLDDPAGNRNERERPRLFKVIKKSARN